MTATFRLLLDILKMADAAPEAPPTLDFRRFDSGRAKRASFLGDVGVAARGPGFFYLIGHGYDTKSITRGSSL
jgi:isopenicillin N synthase-like dioxygenase